MTRPQGMGPGERKVWMALAAIAWIVFVILVMRHMDPTVTCSNNAPC